MYQKLIYFHDFAPFRYVIRRERLQMIKVLAVVDETSQTTLLNTAFACLVFGFVAVLFIFLFLPVYSL